MNEPEPAGRFETEVLVTPELMREVVSALLQTSPRKWLTLAIAVVGGALSGVQFSQGNTLLGALCLGYAAFVVALHFWRRRSFERMTLKRLEETGRLNHRVRTAFTDEGLTGHDEATGGVTTMPYDAFSRAIETKSAFILLSKSRQYTLIGKAGLQDEMTLDALRAFLRERCQKTNF